jgi:hypothetical protein
MAAARLRRGGHGGGTKKRVLNHAHLGGRTTGPSWMHGENAPEGAFCYDPRQSQNALCEATTWEKCGTFSEVASFSSSLKGCYVVNKNLGAEVSVFWKGRHREVRRPNPVQL